MNKSWPRRTVTVPDYNWDIVFFDPSVEELLQLEEAGKTRDTKKLKEIVIGLIDTWDCVDRKDKPLPVDVVSFDKLPPAVQAVLISGVQLRVNKDPKADTASSLVTTQEPGEPNQEESPAL